jgi:hypothetical protein
MSASNECGKTTRPPSSYRMRARAELIPFTRATSIIFHSYCNRVRDRYEDGCAHSCPSRRAQADAVASYANVMKGVTSDYKRKRIKSKYSKKVYTGLTAMRDLSRLLSTIVT